MGKQVHSTQYSIPPNQGDSLENFHMQSFHPIQVRYQQGQLRSWQDGLVCFSCEQIIILQGFYREVKSLQRRLAYFHINRPEFKVKLLFFIIRALIFSNVIFEKASIIKESIAPNIKETNINQTKALTIYQVLNKTRKFDIDVRIQIY